LKIEFGDKLIRNVVPQYGMKWHEILQVSPSASFQEVKTAYRKLATKYHPDLGGSDEEMKPLNWAFDQAQKKIR